MLSLGEQARLAGQRIQLQQNGKTICLLPEPGGLFSAIVSEQTEVDPDMEFGADPREVTIIEAYRDDVPAWILAARADSQVACTVDGVPMTITNRWDSPAGPFVKFRAVKVV